MKRKPVYGILAISIVLPCVLAVALQASHGLMGEEDPFALFDEIARRSRAPSPDSKKPKQVAELVYRGLVDGRNLNFRAFISERPSGKEVIADAKMAQGRFCVVFTIQGKKAWKLLHDGKDVYGVRYGAEGGLRVTKYNSLEEAWPDMPDGRKYGCMSGCSLINWLGDSDQAEYFQQKIENAVYLGSCAIEGEPCDLFFWELKDRGWDAYFVDSSGHVRAWLSLDNPRWWRRTIKRLRSYREISENDLPPQTWELSPEERQALRGS